MAVDLIRARGPGAYDVIALDFEMPMSGPVAARHMRSMGCSALIVGVTGNALKEDMDVFLRAGADEVGATIAGYCLASVATAVAAS